MQRWRPQARQSAGLLWADHAYRNRGSIMSGLRSGYNSIRSIGSSRVSSAAPSRTSSSASVHRRASTLEYHAGGAPNNTSMTVMPPGKMVLPATSKKLLARNHYVANNAGRFTGGVGVQGVQQQLYSDRTTLDAISNLGGTGVQDRFFFEGFEGEWFLTNSTTGTIQMTVYDVIAKDNLSIAIAGSTKVSTPQLCWQFGVDEAGGSATDYNTVGSRPQESDYFRRFWKVVKTHKIELGGGATHRHVVKHQANRVVSATETQAYAYGLKDCFCGSLFVFHGQPAHDSTTGTSVTTLQTAVDFVFKVSYRYRFMEQSSDKWTRSNNLATSFAVGPELINEEAGEEQNAAGLTPGNIVSG